MSEKGSTLSTRSRPETPNVFDFLVPSTVASVGAEGNDSKSVMSSSSSSHYEPSLAGSSEAPDTPSSRSTVPSPTSHRGQSVAELRRRYDPQYTTGARTGSRSPDSSIRRRCIQPSVSDVVEDEEASMVQPSAPPSLLHHGSDRRSSSRSSRVSQDSGRRLKEQEESMRQHMAYAQPVHDSQYGESTFDHQRSPSTSSAKSSPNAYAYEHAMQQYQCPPPPLIAPQPITPPKWNCQISPTQQPPVPDAPDLSQRTIAGYEMLALEISAGESPVRPLYRKFEYLNHRILLHLQDELCELEEQLRTLDEIIAQMDPAMAEGQRSPASRRAETYSNSEIHHRRTSLLGRIFLKTEQYNRAMSAYNNVARSASSAKEEDVRAYQDWMSRHAPVHEMEARFLQAGRDLVLPGKTDEADATSTKQAALACLPAGLMLPLLLFSLIPTLLGRLVVTALIAGGVFIVAATTRIRHLMPVREWAVCGAAYMLLMAAIAGCVPLHG
ncbi:hypothetical protein D0865_12192 [Hortaea werneckii]|uniref:DUF6594 domain-containing protein n=1 Tax=Hortaea werneckii TaxID=91943 RepID=A0A3M7BQ24_HORWE|nr:hypothetical protein D0865_12192 [Hortaea werneckii]